jgi:hypothetical protein
MLCCMWVAEGHLCEGSGPLDPTWVATQGLDERALAELQRHGWLRRQAGGAGDGGWVVTEEGQRQVSQRLGQAVAGGEMVRPEWRTRDKTLWYGGRLVKRYRRRCQQIRLIELFEESGWPCRVHVGWVSGKAKEREHLRDTVRCFNREQKPRVLSFFLGADGETVSWQPEGRERQGGTGRGKNP